MDTPPAAVRTEEARSLVHKRLQFRKLRVTPPVSSHEAAQKSVNVGPYCGLRCPDMRALTAVRP